MVLASNASLPTAVQLLLSVSDDNAFVPTAQLDVPVVFDANAELPTAVLLEAVVFAAKATYLNQCYLFQLYLILMLQKPYALLLFPLDAPKAL